jgi:hypothetical protein
MILASGDVAYLGTETVCTILDADFGDDPY